MNFLKSFWPGKRHFFKLIDEERAYFDEFSISQIRDRTTDGIIVRNFVAEKDCQLLVERMREARKNVTSDPDQGGIFPSTFSQIKQDSSNFSKELQAYFDRSKSFFAGFNAVFGYPLLEEITAFVEGINNGGKLNIIPGMQDGIYIPATFRIQQPEKNSIKLHCGNQFIDLFPKYYQHLSSLVEVDDQLSYFIMLQEPDEGGRLIVYDLTWDEAKECDTGHNTATTIDGKILDLNSEKKVKNQKLYVGTGDLLIFAGGQIWHAVEEVYGTKNRVTFGGFIGFDKKANAPDLYWWS